MAKLIAKVLDFYKMFISPIIPHHCKYHPTCSVYTKQAILKYGVWKGGIMSTWRILRCNPFSKGGYDPVK